MGEGGKKASPSGSWWGRGRGRGSKVSGGVEEKGRCERREVEGRE